MTDLDAALRGMLRERAQDITARPAPELGDVPPGPVDDVVELRIDHTAEHRRRTGVWLAAAAVAVLATAGTLALRGSDNGPDHHKAAALPTVTTSACRVPATAAWTAALAAATRRVPGATGLFVLGTDSTGAAVVDYSPRNAAAPRIGIGLVEPGATTLRPVASLPAPEGVTVGALDGNDLLLVDYRVRHTTDAHGNRVTATEGVRRYRLLDLSDGRVTSLVARQAGLADNAVLRDGQFYYQTAAGIFDRDIAGRTTTRVGAGDAVELQSSAAGVWWHDDRPIDRPAQVPAAVAAHLSGVDVADLAPNDGHGVYRASFVTDGTAWAWSTPGGAVEWWSAGSKHVVRVPGVLGRPYTTTHGKDSGDVLAVAGPYVYLQLPATRSGHAADSLLDTRSGTLVPVRVNLFTGTDGAFVGEPRLPVIVRNPVPQYGTLTRLDTAGLPELHC